MTTLRLERSFDLEVIEKLNRKILPRDPLGAELTESWWWVMNDGRRPVGFCGARPLEAEPKVWFLSRSGLLPAYRGRGLQRRLIRARERCARSLDGDGTWMITYTVVDNPASSNNLIRCGYQLYTPDWRWAGGSLYWRRALLRRHVTRDLA
jgi:GNAT superfamily N-acetyltransferase